jgi:hypothetical protein
MSRRALVIGINYPGTRAELRGCVNDAMNVYKMLLTKGYKSENIVLLTDYTKDKPTKANILTALTQLLTSSAKRMFLHYSGHGTWLQDESGDEKDSRDECLVPVDYTSAGLIKDDQLNNLIKKIKSEQRLTAILDCCHSGTLLDLRHNLNPTDMKTTQNFKYQLVKGKIMMFSGCQDREYSADAFINNKYQGAMSYYFLKGLEDPVVKTYFQLMEKIRNTIDDRFSQRPNLSCSRRLKLNKKIRI